MMAPAAIALGVELRVLVASTDDPAAQVIPGAVIGQADDVATVLAFVAGADALTFEHEHISAEVLAGVEASGVPVRPGPAALLYAQDKIEMRTRLDELGVPVPRWTRASTSQDVDTFLAATLARRESLSDAVRAAEAERDLREARGEHDHDSHVSVDAPLPGGVAKLPRGGYDGRGVRVVESGNEVGDWLADGAVLMEERVDFTRELTVLLARSGARIATWPVVETVQRDGQCAEVVAPALGLDARVGDQASEIAVRLAEALDVSGVFAVEFFQLREQRADGARVVVNELAMRPHNSGHWTIEGSVTSQFEQHIRACLGWPLGETQPRHPWTVMVNVIGGAQEIDPMAVPAVLVDGGVKVHLYGKEVRQGRKVGHVSVSSRDIAYATRYARAAAAVLRGDFATLSDAMESTQEEL